MFGVSHLKWIVIDDDVIITGANLSHEYYTNRQDRYVLLSGCKPLANLISNDLLPIVSKASHQVKPVFPSEADAVNLELSPPSIPCGEMSEVIIRIL